MGRGVFWMRGVGLAGELCVLQYGQWFEEEKIFILPDAPFNWAWPVGVPKSAPYCGWLYSKDVGKGLTGLGDQARKGRAYAFNFGAHRQGQHLPDGDGNDLKYAVLEKLGSANLLEATGAADIFAAHDVHVPGMTGTFTMEEGKGVNDGSAWKRGIYLGCTDSCLVDVGSYD